MVKLQEKCMEYLLFGVILNVVSASNKPHIVIFLADDLVSSFSLGIKKNS